MLRRRRTWGSLDGKGLLLLLGPTHLVVVVVVVVGGGGGVSHPSSGPIHVLHLVGCHYFALNIKIVNIV